MTPDDVRAHLADSRTELLTAVDTVPSEHRDQVPESGGWSVALILEHLHRVEVGIVTRVKRALDEVSPPLRTEGPLPIERDRTPGLDRGEGRFESPERSAPQGGVPADESLRRLEESRRACLHLWDELVQFDAADITLPHFVFGPLNLYEWVDFIGGHERRHALQIRRLSESGTSVDP